MLSVFEHFFLTELFFDYLFSISLAIIIIFNNTHDNQNKKWLMGVRAEKFG